MLGAQNKSYWAQLILVFIGLLEPLTLYEARIIPHYTLKKAGYKPKCYYSEVLGADLIEV
jgi:hypothetical protein